MASRDLRLYIDYKSPYAYLAKDPAYDLEREFGVEFTWLPYVLNIPDFLGTVEGRNPHQWRRVRYSYMDARRLANRRGLTVKGPQKIFDSSLVAIAMLYTQRRGSFRRFNDLAFERFWKRELDIEDRQAVAAVIGESGAPVDAFADFADGEGRRELERVCREAEDELGVFGVPSFVIDGELYWGGDRLWMVRERLAKGAGRGRFDHGGDK
ncbi:MAG TPA: DsbA family protein [Candidatus Binataceae bacterium]|nr:DsbA family protein [Candidatus Binataceae bacterium]